MHLLKESTKPVPQGKKRKKIEALPVPGEPIVIPPRPKPAPAFAGPEEEKKDEENRGHSKSKRNKTQTNPFG